MSDLTKGGIAALVVICVWSGFIVTSRAGSLGVLLPTDLAALRYSVSGLIMLPYLLKHGFGGVSLMQACAITLTAGFGFPLFAYGGFSYAPAAHGAVLLPGVLPLFTTVLAIMILKERFTLIRGLSLALIAAGIGFMTMDTLSSTGGVSPGDFLFLCGSFSWAVFTVLARHWGIAPLTATSIVSVATMVIYTPVYLAFLPSNLIEASWGEIAFQGLYQGLFAVIIAMIAFTIAVRSLGAATTTMITSIVPGTASVAAIFILDEPVSLIAAVGIACVTVGMAVTVAGLRRAAPPSPQAAK